MSKRFAHILAAALLIPGATLLAELEVNFSSIEQFHFENVGDVTVGLTTTETNPEDITARIICDIGSTMKMVSDLLYTNPLEVIIPAGSGGATFNITILDFGP